MDVQDCLNFSCSYVIKGPGDQQSIFQAFQSRNKKKHKYMYTTLSLGDAYFRYLFQSEMQLKRMADRGKAFPEKACFILVPYSYLQFGN